MNLKYHQKTKQHFKVKSLQKGCGGGGEYATALWDQLLDIFSFYSSEALCTSLHLSTGWLLQILWLLNESMTIQHNLNIYFLFFCKLSLICIMYHFPEYVFMYNALYLFHAAISRSMRNIFHTDLTLLNWPDNIRTWKGINACKHKAWEKAFLSQSVL